MKEFGIFTFVMPLIFVFALSYGFLAYTKPFGDDKYVNAVLSFVIAFMAIQFLPILIFIQLIVPYVFALFLVLFLVWIMLKFMGVKEDSIQDFVSHPGFYGVIIAVFLIGIFLFIGMSFPELDDESKVEDPLGGIYVGGQDVLDTGSSSTQIIETDDGTVVVVSGGEEDPNEGLLTNTIFHPTILAMMVLFVTFGVAAYMIVVLKEG